VAFLDLVGLQGRADEVDAFEPLTLFHLAVHEFDLLEA